LRPLIDREQALDQEEAKAIMSKQIREQAELK
jgi:hypothetical protein